MAEGDGMIEIPQELLAKARQDGELAPLMDQAFHNAAPIVRDSLEFFPEYTDHGPAHISAVMRSAWWLVAEKTRTACFTPQDAVALALSALLHDIAMHLTADGFRSLIAEGCAWKPLPGWNEPSWRQLWDDFFLEARRWDDRKLNQVFGERVAVRDFPDELLAVTDADRMLVGEFLRRHHPRLAHEIAVHGFPGAGGRAIPILPGGTDLELRDLLGLIARSHGLPLRQSLKRLRDGRVPGDSWHREALGIHPIFQMALLRIADYLQLQPERAPLGKLELRALRSTVSKLEWRAHACIREIIDGKSDDPELIFIRAKPRDVRSFLKVRQWLDGIQAELDQSWAVLGEVYGRQDERFDLSLRRVSSNIDDCGQLATEVDYHPEAVTFSMVGGKLLKLLVGPLYGDRPELGIRELMQNAVDAVRDREFLCGKDSRLEKLPEGDEVEHVVIDIEVDDEGTPVAVTITDMGVGMTAETVRDYFLRAGATFRDSDDWKNRRLDADGEPQVLKAGRFGVGALAAFLIGNRITVETRHLEAAPDGGIEFEAALDDEIVELRKIRRERSPGTTIRVTELINDWRLSKLLSQNNIWDFYALRHPRVARKSIRLVFHQSHYADAWRVVPDPRFDEVRVHFPVSEHPVLICNGIRIPEARYYVEWPDDLITAPEMPSIAITDNNGTLPITLDRTRLRSSVKLPGLLHPWLHDCLARALAWGMRCERIIGFSPWAATSNGFVLGTTKILEQLGIHRFVATNSMALWVPTPFPGIATSIHAGQCSGMELFASTEEISGADTEIQQMDDSFAFYLKKGGPSPTYDFADLIKAGCYSAKEYMLRDTSMPPSSITQAWLDLVHGIALPYDDSEREARFPGLYERFAEQIAFYRAVPEDKRPQLVQFFDP